MRSGRGPEFAVLFAAAVAVQCHRERNPAERAAREQARRDFAELERRVAEKKAELRAPRAAPLAPAVSASGTEDAPAPPDALIAPNAPNATHRAPNAPGDTGVAPNAAPSAPVVATHLPFLADAPVEIGPPGPATAMPMGVVLNTRDGGLAIGRLSAPTRRATPGPTPIRALPENAGPFALGIGPAYFQDFVYWISHGDLLRRRVPLRGEIGPTEILAHDAFDGTRVAVPLAAPGSKLPKLPATVAYIVRPEKDDAPLLAKLWVEGADPVMLTTEGNSAHSVSLVQTDDGILAVSVQARMAMTPVHARRVRFASGRPLVGDDTVVWVGGGVQPLTEMAVLPHGTHDLFGFIPHERSISEFGIAELGIGMSPSMDTKTTWLLYPNGIDPAPVTAGHLCDEPVLLYAEPESAAPDVEQELVLRALDDPSGERKQRLATGRAFYFVSMTEVEGGFLAAWVTDVGTWASTVRCTNRRK